ncbi:hypothetical protein [Spongiimicrobium sp. 3-5]|uniref:hypothetical protein n=1 Tax=Spongiimicrobium sp. 3-5 TaxID=3332596 RepID=UPI0039804F8C
MKRITATLIVLSINFLTAQKIVEKSFIDPNIQLISIAADHCFSLELGTSDTEEMTVEAHIEGEYQKDLLVSIVQEGGTVFVSTGFQPNFVDPNDKLSAHKVISIALDIELPHNKKVAIYGSSCNFKVSGEYEDLHVVLGDGKCILDQVGHNVDVTTQSGDIWLYCDQAEILADTKYGKLQKERIPVGNDRFTLNTTTGNIYLKKTK